MGMDRTGNRYILHINRIQGRWTQSAPAIMAQADKDGPQCTVAIEANGTQLGYAQEMKERLPQRIVMEDKPEGNKEMRASIWGSRLEDGIIFCVRGEWNQEFFDEMDYFPNGEHDDMVDAVSGGWKILGESTGAWSSRDIAAVARPRTNDGLDLTAAYNVNLSIE
jgi:predicted phage terminase large subunit-like protein